MPSRHRAVPRKPKARPCSPYRHIADEFDASLRTVYRDVRALVEACFPIQGNPGDGYRLTQTSYASHPLAKKERLRPLALSPEEAQALMMAAHAFGASARSTTRGALVRATAKLEAAKRRSTHRAFAEIVARDQHLAKGLLGS
ncbi:hypothetical protein AKJ09_06727 [Labilithrix luteola]|uniref:Helix-turn-helix type 11 domain-containing protein n=1 Tax=Labilithrix luteola TaxID=1391654 RepID=A0A0K1Q2R8_9BACT|nr:HTH domain-containing protein [Labilithrix luteola]AKV00064.1 hypothetical protein AKJ09_06727 [Labilithrix luteola]